MTGTKRAIARFAGALVGCAVLVSAAAYCLWLSLNLAPARRLLVGAANRALASALMGRVTVDRVGRVGLTYVDGVDAHADGADGRAVARIEAARGRLSTWTLFRSLVLGRGDIEVDMPEIVVSHVDAVIDVDENGAVRIAQALAPRPGTKGVSGRSVRLTLSRVRFDDADVHLRLGGGPTLEVTATGVEGRVDVVQNALSIRSIRGPVVVHGLPGGSTAEGRIEGRIDTPPLRGDVHWDGSVGTIRERGEVAYVDRRIDATLDIAGASPDAMRASWSLCPFTADCGGHVEVHGVLPQVDLSARVTLGTGTLDVRGPVVLTRDPSGALRTVSAAVGVHATAFDAHALVEAAPRSNVAFSGDVSIVASPSGEASLAAAVAFEGGTVGSAGVPPARIVAAFGRTAAGAPSAQVEVAVRDKGASARIAARLRPKAGSGSLAVAFDAEGAVARIEDFAPSGAGVRGNATVRGSGTVELRTGLLDARLSATIPHASVRGVSVGGATVEAQARGAVGNPSIDVAAGAEAIDARSVHLSAVHAHASARLATHGAGVQLRDVELDAAGGGELLRAGASLLDLSAGRSTIDGAWIEGLGAPVRASVRAVAGTVSLRASSAGLDLARVGAVGGLPVHRGTLAFDIDGAVSSRSADGRIKLDLSGGSFLGVDHANAAVEVTLRGRQVSGSLEASVARLGTVEIHSSSVHVGPGPLLTASPWKKTWGALQFVAHVDLAGVEASLPRGALPFDRLAGSVEMAGRVNRDDADDDTPDLEMTAKTDGLTVWGSGASGPWRVQGVDPTLQVLIDGDSGRTALALDVRDAAGLLARLQADSASVPYAVLLSDNEPGEALRAMRFAASIDVPTRRLDALSFWTGWPKVAGDLSAKVTWRGSIAEPVVDLTANVKGGRADPSLQGMPVDLAVSARYDGARVEATFLGRARERQVLEGSARFDVRAGNFVPALRGAAVPWKASGRAAIDKLPLRSIAFLNDRQVAGRVSGQVTVDGLHDDGRASLSLAFDGLKVGDLACRSSDISVHVDGHAADASARLDHGDGHVEIKAHAGTRWGTAVSPALDPSQSAKASVEAKGFRAGFLLPFVSKWFTELDGRIDADAQIQHDDPAAPPKATGAISIADATFELPSFGGQFRDASATANFAPDGVVRIENAFAHGGSGSVRGSATARFDRVGLAGVRATVVLPASDPLPLVFDGVQMGILEGRFAIAMDRGAVAPGLDVAVDASNAQLELPSGSTSIQVQPLGDLDKVRVGIKARGGEFSEVSGPTARDDGGSSQARAPIRIALHINDLQVTRGADLDVRLDGQPTVTLAGDTRVAGQIQLLRGTIDVQGHRFQIERGTVTFVGDDPANPQVVLTASWEAPDGTQIYAEFVGPLKTGKVTLRSEPSRPQSEILALLLFGTAEGRSPSSATGMQETSAVAAVAGGAATQPINRALDRALGGLGIEAGISTKIDTSGANPRPEVEVQIARDISIQIAWVVGALPPGNPDSTLLTLNWHFLRQWSLETTVGDAGTSILDLVWQRRY